MTYEYALHSQMMIDLFQESVGHHLANAAKHELAGNPQWAEGSRVKAAKWQRRVEERMVEVKRRREDPILSLIDDYLTHLTRQMTTNMEAALLHG